MIQWPLRQLLNLVYALLAERADALDRTELLFSPHVDEKYRDDMAHHREELDSWLSEPMGRQAEAERALIKALGG